MEAKTVKRVKRQAEAPKPKVYCQSVYDEASKYSGWNPHIVQAIATAESGCVMKDNLSGSEQHNGCRGSYGILQVGCIHFKPEDNRSDFETNIRTAHGVWQRRNNTYEAWTMYKNGEYKRFLK